jgi:hypothetical protein
MSDSTRYLKIKLDIPESTMAYNRVLKQWEDEGGAVPVRTSEDLVPGCHVPFTPGECFRVIRARIDLSGDEFFYIADIEIIPAPVPSTRSQDHD